MSSVDRAAEVLREAESLLRLLVAECATRGDYADVVQITAWATALSEIRDGGKNSSLTRNLPVPLESEPRRTVVKARAPVRQNEYPRFFQRDGRVVRASWSKRDKKEYYHSASFAAIQALSASMEEKGADGRVFSTEEILPVYDDDGMAVPAYQAYVGIALFRWAGLIDKHGRRGYSIPTLLDFKHDVAMVWQKLPQQPKH
jgi:hypothetical protein